VDNPIVINNRWRADPVDGITDKIKPRRRLDWGRFALGMFVALSWTALTTYVNFNWRSDDAWRWPVIAFNLAISAVFFVAAFAALLNGKQ
jgi:hypothetical protein